MAKLTRGEFLRWSAAAAAGVGAPAVFSQQNPLTADTRRSSSNERPDLIVVNGNVLTMDETTPRVEAFAVKNGRFMAIGSESDIRNLAGPATEILDAEQMLVTPGFIDAHSHPAGGGVREIVSVNVDVRTIDGIKDAIRARAAKTPKGEWILGFKYDDTKVREGRQVNRHDLDQAAPDHPVYISHRGGHVYWLNSKAFEAAGVTRDTPQPTGGHIYKDDDGSLNGKIAERATALFRDHLPSGSTREQRQAGVKLISEMMTSSGLTSVTDASCSPDSATAYQDAYHAGEMRFRVYLLVRGQMFEGLKTAGVYSGFGDDWLKVGGVKFGADGSASGRTMAMSTPYEGRPDDHGILTMTQEEIHEAVEDAHRHDFQIGIHANGDLAIEMVLNAYERVLEKWPRKDPRHRLEHCSLVNKELLTRIRDTGSIPTPFYTYVHYHGRKWEEYGQQKMEWMFAHKSFLDYGIKVAPASDYVPGPYEPMMAIQSMVTRKDVEGQVWGASQAISVEDAIRICTVNGAYASFEEDIKGSISAGKLADFVFLGGDPRQTNPDEIKQIKIARTVVGGKTMYTG